MKRVGFSKGILLSVLSEVTLVACLLSTLQLSWAVADDTQPAADVHCQISEQHRAQRIQFVDGILQQIDRDTRTAQQSLQTFRDALSDMNDAQIAGDICLGISMVAGTIAGVGAVYEVFFSGEAVTFFGITSQTVIRGVTAVGAATRVVEIPAGIVFLLHERPAYASEAPEIHRQKVEAMRGLSLFPEGAVNLLTSDDCTGERCGIDQPQIDQAWHDLMDWHDAEERHLEETDGHWYNPFSWEWHTHHYANGLAEVEIPWATNAVDLLRMKRVYFQLLRDILAHDRDACAARNYSM